MPHHSFLKMQRMRQAKKRVARLQRLRAHPDCPRWVIKCEQVALVLNRAGMRFAGLGQPMSMRQHELYAKHVIPLLDKPGARS